MKKTEQFQDAVKKITYWDVIDAFNRLNDRLNGEFYGSSDNLVSSEGQRVPGFVYTGYAAGVGIGKILDNLKIKYITYIKSGSGVEEQAEIHIIDDASQKRILDIFKKCSGFQSNVKHEKNVLVARDSLLQQIR